MVREEIFPFHLYISIFSLSLSISSFSLHFLTISSPFPHPFPISSQPGCQAAAGCDSLLNVIGSLKQV